MWIVIQGIRVGTCVRRFGIQGGFVPRSRSGWPRSWRVGLIRMGDRASKGFFQAKKNVHQFTITMLAVIASNCVMTGIPGPVGLALVKRERHLAMNHAACRKAMTPT